MSPLLSIALALLGQIKPEDVAAIAKQLVTFLDPIIATKGPFVRFVWSMLRGMATSSLQADLAKIIAEVKQHPDVAKAATQWAV